MDSTLSSSKIFSCFVMLTIFVVGWYALSVDGGIGSWRSAKVWIQGNWQSFRRRIPIRAMTEGSEIHRRLMESDETKIILVWHRPGWMSKPPRVWHPDCGKCNVTVDKSMINNTATKAVVFYYGLVTETNMPSPQQRNPDQLHIVWTKEPPPNIRNAAKAVNSTYQFNGTMSYRRSADFLSSYNVHHTGRVAARNISDRVILEMKKKGGVAIVSNCYKRPGPRMRLKILEKIKSLGFPLDGYGKCFPSGETVPPGWKAGSHTRQYRFYFSFENSYHCRDYITEKVFQNAFLHATAVPVVFGATKHDYESLLPKGSFIIAEDFESLQKLVDYLNYLMKNDTAYLEYFRWHKKEPLLPENPEPKGGRDAGFCQLCRAIHGVNIDDRHDPTYDRFNPKRPLFTDGIARRTMKSFRSYVFDEDNKECNEDNETNWKIYRDWKLDD